MTKLRHATSLVLLVASLVGSLAETGMAREARRPALVAAVPVSLASTHRRALDLAAKHDLKGAILLLRSVGTNGLAREAAQTAEWDRLQLSLARLLYESGDFIGAIEAYDRVERHGSSWLEAIEEKAWALYRAGRLEESIAQLKTATSAAFSNQARSEPFFLLALVQLRICDFPALYRTLDQFKVRYRERVKSWEQSMAPVDRERLRELGATVQKLNLVEAEAIQRLYLESDGRKAVSVPKVKKAPGQLSFPATEGDEVWLDELEDFKVSVRGCLQPVAVARAAGQYGQGQNGKRSTLR